MMFEMLLLTIVAGTALWAFNTFWTSMNAKVRKLINAIVLTALVIWWLLFFLHWAGVDTGRF